jgi:hypothetical protein
VNPVVSENSTHDRGIAHVRDEPPRRARLSPPAPDLRRERSDLASWLRVGTTALIVTLIDGGVACGAEVELDASVEACERSLTIPPAHASCG